MLNENLEYKLRESYVPWLVEGIREVLINKNTCEALTDRVVQEPRDILLIKHAYTLQKERDRLRKIEEGKQKDLEDFEEGRRERRERRRLLRLNRDKRGLLKKITDTIQNRQKNDVADPLAVRMVELDGSSANNEFVFVIPGGLLLELFMITCHLRIK